MHVETRRQQDAVFYCDRAMREGGDEELIPACGWKKKNQAPNKHGRLSDFMFIGFWGDYFWWAHVRKTVVLLLSLYVKCYTSRGQEIQFY